MGVFETSGPTRPVESPQFGQVMRQASLNRRLAATRSNRAGLHVRFHAQIQHASPDARIAFLPTGQALQSRVVSAAIFCGKTLAESTFPPRLKSSKTRAEYWRCNVLD